MADKEKVEKVKKKKVKKEVEEAPAAAATPEPEPEPVDVPPPARSSTKKGSKKHVKRSGSNVFSMFTTGQVAEFKEGFSFMDMDKDGILGNDDLRATWDQVGKLVTDQELDDMLDEAPGPVNFTQLLSLFAARMAGGADDDAEVRQAVNAFDENGKIDTNGLKHALISWGDKFTAKEVNDAFDNLDIDKRGMVDSEELIAMLTGKGDEE